ncbi:short-chain dehydrogenase reductase sdr [Fusarium pseudocircinatum]|uniref:Short-chain dehydrogenase reductase sdr n=1 Tax=Fusarium pseudocircinatum TaxID=56676 RepID=A0A8H5LAN8_9HYPO|nr:short-chain dehydrogenase reductase sdr [Fusarium pseudocircinatum]
MSPTIVVIIGCGGMGLDIARRLGTGRRLFLADFSQTVLGSATNVLKQDGYSVDGALVDVSDYASVTALALAAAEAGTIGAVIHTAGLSPNGGSARRIYEVDLVGTANVIDAFLPVATFGTSLVCISSMAGHMVSDMSPELERHLATAPRDELLNHPNLTTSESDLSGPARAYGMSKRGNLLRVQAAATAWGRRGARVNSVSPGVISTSTGRKEIEGAARKFIETSPARRVGVPQDIVSAVAFLVSPDASFITGNDLLVDGGVVSSLRWKD